MDNRTKTIGAVLLILILAVAAVGYAINYYAEHKGGEVDPDYLVITDLDTSEVEFNTVEHNIEGYGKIATSTPKEGTKLVYSIDDSKVEGAYYLTLVSYVLYLDDGTVITGTVDGTGNNISVNYDKSTVVTRTDLKLYLDSFTPDSEKKISFSLDGAMISNSEFPVYGDKTAPATGAGLKTIDVKLGVTKYDQEHAPQISLTINSSNATGVEYLTVGSTGSLVYDLKIDGALNYGYAVEWAISSSTTYGDIAKIDYFGNVTGLKACTDAVDVTAKFNGNSATSSVKVCVADVEITGPHIHGQKMRIAVGGSQAIDINAVHPATAAPISYTDMSVVSDNVNFAFDSTNNVITVAATAADRETATFTVSFQDAIGATYVGFFFVETFDARIDIAGPSSAIGSEKFAVGTVQEIDVVKSVYGHEIKWTAETAGKVLFSVDKIRWATTITTDEPIVYFKGIADGDHIVISADYAASIDQTTVTTKDTITVSIVTPTLSIKYDSTTLDKANTYYIPEYGTDLVTADTANIPSNAIIMWSSDNDTVISVDEIGVIKALRYDALIPANNLAHVRVYVTIDNVEFSSDTINFKVFRPTVDIQKSSASLPSQSIYKEDVIDGVSVEVTTTGFDPSVATNVLLGTSVTSLVSLDDAQVTVSGTGPYTITGTEATDAGVAVEGRYALANYVYKDTVYINVVLPDITILGSDFAIAGGNTKVLGYSIVKGAGTSTAPVWEITEGDTYVRLDDTSAANPTLTALKTGEATIKVSFSYGTTTYKDDIVVSVPISITNYTSAIPVSDSVDLDVDPIVAVNWTSSDTSVATVSQAGVVTGQKAGTAVITATGKVNGISYSAVQMVEVTGTVTTHTVTIAVNDSNKGSVDVALIPNVPDGAVITVNDNTVFINGTTQTATPSSASYVFDSWTNATGTVDADRTITAVFANATHTVTINVNDSNMGEVSKTSIVDVPHGSAITVNDNSVTINGETSTATPSSASYVFDSWTGVTGRVNEDMSIMANFTNAP